MKLIVIAIVIQILSTLFLDFLDVKFEMLKWVHYDDIFYWTFNVLVLFPLYFKGYLSVYKKKWLAVILAVVSFIVFGVFSVILMLFFHTEVLNAPL